MTDASTEALTAIDRLYLHVDQGLPAPDLSDLWEEVCAKMKAVELAEAERDALRAAILKHVEDFRPIDTAPKNGEWFIGMNEFYPQFLQPMSYHAETGRYAVISPDAPDGMVKTIRPDYPTHWWPPAIKGKDDA